MKKLIPVLILSVLSTTAVYAFNQIPLGTGTISPGSPAVIDLSQLKSQYIYRINCTLTDPEGNTNPAIFRADTAGLGFDQGASVFFDGNPLATNQAEISDSNNHDLMIGAFWIDGQIKPSFTLTDLTGGAVNYNCNASYAVGQHSSQN